MKRILHIVGGMCLGGAENFIMNVYRNIDREKLQFDFIVHKRVDGDFCNEIESMGGRIYLAPRKSKHPIKNLQMIADTVKENKYEIVERHSANAYSVLDLKAAKKGGATRLIFHSHSTNTGMKMVHKFFRMQMKKIPTDRFTCSDNAGKWMYGKLDYKVICNAIDIEKYAFNIGVREEVREELNLNDKHIFMHVGNLRAPKNHIFLLEYFNLIASKDENAVLVLVGEGNERVNIEAKIDELKLSEKVMLLGVRHDIARLLQAADIFFLPSVYEGLPVSVIEAQAAGLICLLSDVVTKDVAVTNNVHYLSLNDSYEIWADKSLTLLNESIDCFEKRKDTASIYKQLSKAGYDVKMLAKFYENL